MVCMYGVAMVVATGCSVGREIAGDTSSTLTPPLLKPSSLRDRPLLDTVMDEQKHTHIYT